MTDVRNWSADADNNSDAPPDGFPEGMAYSEVNNAAREIMAAMARYTKDVSGVLESGGSSTALTLSPYNGYTANTDGDAVSFRLHAGINVGATLAVGTADAVEIQNKDGDALTEDEVDYLSSGSLVDARYYSDGWRLINLGAVSTSIPSSRVIWFTSVQVSGSSNSITLTPDPAIQSYTAGLIIVFIAEYNNYGSVTVNISNRGNKSFRKFNGISAFESLDDGDILDGDLIAGVYDGTRFIKLTQSSSTKRFSRLTISSTTPSAWNLVDGELYLQY